MTVCKTGSLEEFCKLYPEANYKPTGLLHEYGENNAMYFGMLSGSFNNSVQGGVLRHNNGLFTGSGGMDGTLGLAPADWADPYSNDQP